VIDAGPAPDREVERAAPAPLDLGLTLGAYRLSSLDPTARAETAPTGQQFALATRTPAGAATLVVAHDVAAGRLTARAWGDGAGWLIDRLDRLLGADDDPDGLSLRSPAVGELARRFRGLRVGVAPSLHEALARLVLRQRVAYGDAAGSWAALVRRHGRPAPGPGGLLLAPTPEELYALPGASYRACAVDGHRSVTLRRIAERAARGRLEPLGDGPRDAAAAALAAIPGVGPWTVGMARGLALGDADAVVPGDLHLPQLVSFALTGQPAADDARMIELLEPYRGHRFRLLRLLWAAGRRPPRGAGRGPR
jgi:3-methyladenine DNA glycosylase/8-oxoguanine DNA glycosylase